MNCTQTYPGLQYRYRHVRFFLIDGAYGPQKSYKTRYQVLSYRCAQGNERVGHLFIPSNIYTTFYFSDTKSNFLFFRHKRIAYRWNPRATAVPAMQHSTRTLNIWRSCHLLWTSRPPQVTTSLLTIFRKWRVESMTGACWGWAYTACMQSSVVAVHHCHLLRAS